MNIALNIGEKLHLSVKTKDQKNSRMMVSQVLECCGDDTYVIAMPMHGGRLVPVQTGQEIRLAYYRENGVYEFTAQVLTRSGGSLPSLKIKALSPVQKSQRRNFYRLNTVLPVKIYFDPAGEEETREVKCLTLDISAGGMRLASDIKVEKDNFLICELALLDKTLSLKAKVVRSIAVFNEEYSFEIGVQFLELDEKVRSEIIGYIFDEQRKLKRKGLI